VIGRAPLYQQGAWVWYGLGPDAPLRLDPSITKACAAGFDRSDPLGVPRCVLEATHAGTPTLS
jgi:hypothetical protein